MALKNDFDRRTAFSVLAMVVLLPVLIIAQAEQKKLPEERQTVDLGVFRVSAPPGGKWAVTKENEPLGAAFTRRKKDLLGGVLGPGTGLGQERETQVRVLLKVLELHDWPRTEKETMNEILRYNVEAIAEDPEQPGTLVDKGETALGDKKLHFLEFKGTVAGTVMVVNSYYCFYFPSDFKRTHRYFEFASFFYHKGKGFMKLYKNPGAEPALQLVESLEIADPLGNVPGPDGELLRAAAAGDVDAAGQAIDRGAKADAAAPHLTALSAAAFYGHRNVVEFLIGKGADIDKADMEGGRTPVHQALIGNEPEIAGVLIQAGADPDARTLAGFSPLMYASIYGLSDLVTTLLGRGADVNARTNDGESPLVLAAQSGAAETARLLMDGGADLNAQTNDGWNALMRAVGEKHPEIARSLLEHGADAGLKAKDGWTALARAVQAADLGTVRALIEKGADVNARLSKYQWTPLLLALAGKEADAIALALIEAGADVKAKLDGGSTALMFAAENASADIVKLLIGKGVDVNAKNSDKYTALKFASKKKRADIVQILKAAGAK